MPKPEFIICAESGVIDEKSKKVSLFNILEVLTIWKDPSAIEETSNSSRLTSFFLIAKWRREAIDTPDQVFEAQIIGHFPNEDGPEMEIVATGTTFSFTNEFHKIVCPAIPMPGFFGPGIFRIECRLRHVGELAWIASQEFSIVLEKGIPTSSQK